MVKTAFSLLIGLLLCMWSTLPVMARILESKDSKPAYGGGVSSGNEQIGSKDYGYVSAKDLWKNGAGNYSCDKIVPGYWRDVNKIVFDDCDYKWTGPWAEQASYCKSGAEQFTMEQIGECFKVTDCYHLGVGAASSVAGSFCKREGLFHDRDWLPLQCVKHAEASCKCDAVNVIQEFFEGGVCTSMEGSALDYVDEIHQLCETEVYEMEQNAKLPWY